MLADMTDPAPPSAVAEPAPPQSLQPAGAGPRLDWAGATEARVLAAACALVREGARWSEALTPQAAKAAGFSAADAALLMPHGARDLAALLWRRHDAAATDALDRLDPAGMKVRERVRAGVLARLDAAMADEAEVRAANLYLARPDRAALALQLGWATADAIWRWAGDTATDVNHYTKRALLWGILASTLAVRLGRGGEAAERHLDARIDQVMGFERWKAKLPPLTDGLTVLAANLGKLRYRG